MKDETKGMIFFISIVVLIVGGIIYFGIFHKTCDDLGTCRNGDCSVGNFNSENCQRMMDEYKAQYKIAWSCMQNLNKYIEENNLTCDTKESSTHPLNSQRTKYKCCKNCYYLNNNGSDYSETICKI